jgi:GDP-L-fucose synthase
VGFKGQIVWDKSAGWHPRKLMDSSRLFALGWKPHIALEAGIAGLPGFSEQIHGDRETL